jgi:N-acetylmuramoyl-L-alanine amidase
VALTVALLLGAILNERFDVIYTRRDDTFVSLERRAMIANDAGADALISLHCNSGPTGQGDGFEVFTSPGETPSDKLAVDLFTAYAAYFPHLRKRMDLSDGDVDKEANFTVLTRSRCRAVLFELEFIHTPVGVHFLTHPANQARMAEALATGTMRHFQAGSDETAKAALKTKLAEAQELLGKL